MPHQLAIRGFGRSGSYAKAKTGHYCRSRKYWAICRWSDDSPIGWMEMPEYGHFKTKKSAIHFAEQNHLLKDKENPTNEPEQA